MKRIIVVLACLGLIAGGFVLMSTVDESTPIATAAGSAYSGTIYVAGMGGHFAVAKVKIDPSAETPIMVEELDMIAIGTGATHPTHDARIDSANRAQMFWSTYKADKNIEGGKTAHVGLSDLKTGKVLMDVPVKLDDRVGFDGALYCGSGQSKDYFMPVTMTKEAYIDVFSKKDLKLKHRVFLDKEGYTNNYIFFHGTNSPDMKTFMVSINMTKPWANNKDFAPEGRIGKIDNMLLDMAALEKGKVKILAKGTVSGDPAKTFTFRQYFTPDGKLILQSGADRMYVLDATSKDLKLVDEEMMTHGENHDAIATPDSKYAILTLRTGEGKEGCASPTTADGKGMDGTLQLYDIAAKKVIGKPSSVCGACHVGKGMKPDLAKAVLCGLDANWN